MSTRARGQVKVRVQKLAELPGEIGELAKALLVLIDSVNYQAVQVYELQEGIRMRTIKRSPSASPEHI